MKVLVAYDGTLQSKDALKYGLEKVKEHGGHLVAFHVFNRPLFHDYDALPWAQERAMNEALGHLVDAERIIEESGAGIRARFEFEEGDPEEEIISYAVERNVDLLLCPARYRGVVAQYKKKLEEGKTVVEDTPQAAEAFRMVAAKR